MTLETMQYAADMLHNLGYRVTLEYPGFIEIEVPRSGGSGQSEIQIATFGDCNETFGATLYADAQAYADGITDGYLETPLPSSETDPQKVCDAILDAIDPDRPKTKNAPQGD